MDTLLSEDEALIKATAADFLDAEAPPSLARAAEKAPSRYSPDLWARIARLGWSGLCLPEECGGQAAPLSWMGLLLEEVGRHVAPIPLYHVAATSIIVARFGSDSQCRGLRDVTSGASILTYGLQEEGGQWDLDSIQMTGRIEDDEIVLSGAKFFVDGFASADRILVVFRTEQEDTSDRIALALVDAKSKGIHARPLTSTAKGDQCVVAFSDVRVPRADLIGQWGKGRAIATQLMQLAAAFLASQMAGAARRATELAVEYAKIRVAFGQPIGSFQSIQHLAADMIIAVDGAELLAREALWRLDRGISAGLEVAQAKAFANQHCLAACRSAQQIHGGMGFMLEFDLHLWYRRVVTWSLCAGSTHEHRKTIAGLLLDRPGHVRLDDCQLDAEAPRELAA